MKPKYISLVELFGAPARYTVPLFQRPYVWKREEQWEPLWDDIANLAGRVLAAGPGGKVAGHFLGTIVLEQAMTSTGSIGCREIIDGQQRLTTLQVLLHAVEHALAPSAATEKKDAGADGKGVRVAARQIAILTANAAYAEEEEKYKVWPTNDDRAAFRRVMDASGPESLPRDGALMVEAYHFFHEAISNWLGAGEEASTKAIALVRALQTYIRSIVLDLEESDEPQAIFETLNAHGTPLLPGDLIKNWLLWEAKRQNLTNVPELYESYWRPFDTDHEYWRSASGTGHAARPRLDTFLQNWLTRRTREEIPAKHLYQRFLQHASPRSTEEKPPAPCDIPALMADIRDDGARYREIENPIGHTRFDTFLRRLPAIGFVVFHPVLLALMGRSGSDQADRDAAAIALESYLVRRIICWEQTRAYSDVTLSLLDSIAAVDQAAPVGSTLARTLAEQRADAYRWPDDEKFRNAWLSNVFYGGYRRSRVMMILQVLEEFYQHQDPKSEPIASFDFSSLTIEHVMPRKWQEHWPLPPGENAKAERERRLNGIGNLTLVTGKLNPSLSNAAWSGGADGERGKRSALCDHSKLQLNACLVKKWPKVWNEAAIDERAKLLFEAARTIWPLPTRPSL